VELWQTKQPRSYHRRALRRYTQKSEPPAARDLRTSAIAVTSLTGALRIAADRLVPMPTEDGLALVALGTF
jgi:hypothetical protein